jgi:hypothetical protein
VGGRLAVAGAVLATVAVVVAGGILLSRPDGSTPHDPAVAAVPSPSSSRSPIPDATPWPSAGASVGPSATTDPDGAYDAGAPKTATLYEFPEPTDVKAMTVGPDGGVYYIAPSSGGRGDSVWRLNSKHTKAYEIIRMGDGRGPMKVGRPRLLAPTARDEATLLLVDDEGALWRWFQRGDKDEGALSYLQIPDDVAWDDIRDIATLTLAGDPPGYNMYVLDPDSDRILKYTPTLDGSRFDTPRSYLVDEAESAIGLTKLFIDSNVYALSPDNAAKHANGRKVDWALDDPPDDGIRHGHRYRLIDGTGPGGLLFVYDEQWGRILVFDKSDGSYIEQWATRGPQPSMADMRGMSVTQGGTPQDPKVPRVTWATPHGIYRSTLTPTAADLSTPAPEASPQALPTRPSPAAPAATTDARAIDWQTPGSRLRAASLAIDVNDLLFTGVTPDVDLSGSEPGTPTDRTLEAIWSEHDREQRMFIDFEADETDWWVSKIRVYDGLQDEPEWIEFQGPLWKTPRGETFEGDVYLRGGKGGRTGTIDIRDMRLTAFAPGTGPAPRPACDRATKAQIESLGRPETWAGVDDTDPREWERVLEGMGVCFEFHFDYDYPPGSRYLGFSERWCAPPPGTVRGFARVEARKKYPNRGLLIVMVSDGVVRPPRDQPPGGWYCPTQ